MSNLVNLERDMVWTDAFAPVAGVIANPIGTTFSVGTTGLVGDIVSSARLVSFLFGAAASPRAFGALILEPLYDTVPYRFKSSVTSPSSRYFGFGYASTVGVSAVLENVYTISGGSSVDEIVAISPLPDGHPNKGNPLCFYFIGEAGAAGGNCAGHMSVQRLLSKPPKYASANA